MKFGKRLRAEGTKMGKSTAAHLLKYKKLKRDIKERHEQLLRFSSAESAEKEEYRKSAIEITIKEFEEELSSVCCFFARRERELSRRLSDLHEKMAALRATLQVNIHLAREYITLFSSLSKDATEARKFAALNYLGMRKICRKLDKLLSEHREGEKTKGMNYFDERMPETCLAVSTVPQDCLQYSEQARLYLRKVTSEHEVGGRDFFADVVVPEQLGELDLIGQFNYHVASGDRGAARKVLDNNPSLPIESHVAGRNALQRAAMMGHLACVELLLQHNARVGSCDLYGRTPLHLAAAEGFVSIIQLLLQHGSERCARDSFGHTPLHRAAWEGHSLSLEALLADASEEEVFFIDTEGNNVMHIAASSGFVKGVITVLSHKEAPALLHTRDADGSTPLHKATAEGYADILKVLIEAGADVNAVDEMKRTPLHVALQVPAKQCVRALLDASASVAACDIWGIPPLAFACSSGDAQLVEWVLAAGADINAVDDEGLTSLHHSISGRKKGVVRCLCERGADVMRKSLLGLTPYDQAVFEGMMDLAVEISKFVNDHDSSAAEDTPAK